VWFIGLAERARDGLGGAEQAAWLHTLGADLENLRKALRSSLDAPDPDASLRMSAALFRFFEVSGRPAEGRRWIEEALAAPGGATPELVADAQFGLAMLCFDQSDFGPARVAIEACVRARGELGDRAGVARAANLHSLVLHYLGDFDAAHSVQEESLALSRELGLEPSVSQGIFHLGMLATARGDHAEAAARLEEAAARWREAGNRLAAAGALLNLCEVERSRGNLDRAAALIDECLDVGRDLGAMALVASGCTFKGYLLGVRGEPERARRFFEEAIALHGEAGNPGGKIEVVESVAFVAASLGDAALAARLVSAGTAARAAIGFARDPAYEIEVEQLLARVRVDLGQSRAEAAESAGRGFGLERAVDAALGGLV
jgi:tetratricopeptide (TPR) repeat protein